MYIGLLISEILIFKYVRSYCHFTYVTTHSPTLPSLYLRHSSFSNPSVTSRSSQFILQLFFRFSSIIGSLLTSAHSPTFPSLQLRHSSFSNPSVALPMSQLILQPFRRFTYVTDHSPTLLSLYLRHSLFSNPSIALPMLQLILQPFFRFSYVAGSSLTSPGEPPMPCCSAKCPSSANYRQYCRL